MWTPLDVTNVSLNLHQQGPILRDSTGSAVQAHVWQAHAWLCGMDATHAVHVLLVASVFFFRVHGSAGAAASTPATGDLTEWLSTVVDEDPFPQDFVECNEYGSGDWPDGPHERCRSAC